LNILKVVLHSKGGAYEIFNHTEFFGTKIADFSMKAIQNNGNIYRNTYFVLIFLLWIRLIDLIKSENSDKVQCSFRPQRTLLEIIVIRCVDLICIFS
jgi:hypothetical protein